MLKCIRCQGMFEFKDMSQDGGRRLSYCKACKRKAQQRYRADKAEHYNHYHRAWNLMDGLVNKEVHTKKSRERYANTNPEVISAHSRVSTELAAGTLVKQPCEVCGNKRVEAHHEDYSKPLEVVWLCSVHHRQRHIELKEGSLSS